MRFIPTEKQPKRIRLAQVLKKIPQLKRFFAKQPVDLVFLHGSLAKDRLKPLSDIDIAIQFRKPDYSFKEIGEIKEKLSELLGREDIDLAIMNRASPLLCMQVLCNGKLLYSRSEKVLGAFRLRTIQRYLATKYLRTSFNRYMEEAILREK